MTVLNHPVSPEEIMAVLDGESTIAQQQAIQKHVDACNECAQIVEQFRRSSAQLHSWTVEGVPLNMVNAVLNQLEEAAPPHGKDTSERRVLWPRLVRLALLSSGSIATLLLIFLFLTRDYRSAKLRAFPEEQDSLAEPSWDPHPLASMSSKAYMRSQTAPRPLRALDARVPAPSGSRSELNPKALEASPAPPPFATPMIARTASLSIIVKNVASSRASLDSVLARYHGYAANLTVMTPENVSRSFQASLRVPASELAAALADIKSMGRVENETQSGEEVTQQHADLLAHLKNARETEQRFQAILQQRTGKVEDVLEVEKEIARVRGEIETMEADQQVLEHRVDFASVDLQLVEEYKARFSEGATPSISTRFHNALVSGFRHARNTTLAILFFMAEAGPTVLVLAAIFGVPAFLLWRRYRRVRERVD